MALPILDGNQTATTLSTIITGGAHIPAHTVVSLGSQAISDISNAVSSVQVSGVVTANSSAFYYDGANNVTYSYSLASWVDGEVFPASYADPLPAQLSYLSSGNILRVSTANPLPIQVVSQPSVTISNFPSTQTIAGTVTANLSQNFVSDDAGTIPNYAAAIGFGNESGDFSLVRHNAPFPISGTVTVSSLPASTVTVSSLPTISGTVTVSSLPRPTWTDYSGSVATANSAVTAISTVTRSYLLAQVTTGQMFLNIGASCTTGNGVYFSAGQGFAWETVVPQGVVSLISSVTGTNYVLKDG